MLLRRRYYLNVSDWRILCGTNMDNRACGADCGVVLSFPKLHKQGQIWGLITSLVGDKLINSGDIL
jgi:hypothetical protein